jgi:glycerol-3-phosphate dehydrogenase (NAD(P)+)
MRLAIFGAGAWGTALARHASTRHPVMLWTRDPAQAAEMAALRQNRRYLPGVALGDAVTATADLGDAARFGADLHVVATSVAGLGPLAAALEQVVPGAAVPMLWLCKGLEADTALLPHQVVARHRPAARSGVLSGPSFAQEVAAGLPVALTVASGDPTVCDAALAALHHGAVRLYRGDDLVGVEVAGAVKNVIAIAAGISDGLGLGLNARAALLTRGLAEIGRFGAALGARPETFMGLAGVGDLVLTCTGDLSRNRRVGFRIAGGDSLDGVLASLGHVAEGVACCRAVLCSAAALGVDMPITAAVGAVLFEGRAPRDMVAELLAREPRSEQA